jgi:hypothetical protein
MTSSVHYERVLRPLPSDLYANARQPTLRPVLQPDDVPVRVIDRHQPSHRDVVRLLVEPVAACRQLFVRLVNALDVEVHAGPAASCPRSPGRKKQGRSFQHEQRGGILRRLQPQEVGVPGL